MTDDFEKCVEAASDKLNKLDLAFKYMRDQYSRQTWKLEEAQRFSDGRQKDNDKLVAVISDLRNERDRLINEKGDLVTANAERFQAIVEALQVWPGYDWKRSAISNIERLVRENYLLEESRDAYKDELRQQPEAASQEPDEPRELRTFVDADGDYWFEIEPDVVTMLIKGCDPLTHEAARSLAERRTSWRCPLWEVARDYTLRELRAYRAKDSHWTWYEVRDNEFIATREDREDAERFVANSAPGFKGLSFESLSHFDPIPL